VVRAYIQHRLYQDNPVQKLFTVGPMFRHERPQKGRFRQFHQINAEIFGDPGPRSDSDIINMLMQLFMSLGMTDLTLNLNSLGCRSCRAGFREDLRNYLAQRSDALCPDCRRRANANPLRVFDCKVEGCRDTVSGAPSILEYICDECKGHFNRLQGYLEEMNISFILNNRLMRGLDYYSRTTFEIRTQRLGAQNAVAGGGRYDELVKQLGGPDHPGIGFAIGIERLMTLLDGIDVKDNYSPELFIAWISEKAEDMVFKWINELRRSGIRVEAEYGLKGLKIQMKRADRLGAKRTLIIGDDELAAGRGILRDMETKEQIEVELNNPVELLKEIIGSRA
jgi:histidyl-tRNA synthetase